MTVLWLHKDVVVLCIALDQNASGGWSFIIKPWHPGGPNDGTTTARPRYKENAKCDLSCGLINSQHQSRCRRRRWWWKI